MNAKELRQLLPVLHAFAYRGIVEYKPLDGDTWTRINPDTTEFRPESMNPMEWRWTPLMPDDDDYWDNFMADYTEAELKSQIEELKKRIEELEALIDRAVAWATRNTKESIIEITDDMRKARRGK